ncbi:MAG: hypothetical protein ACYTFD_20330, partial [Planctomycetota bacterium]
YLLPAARGAPDRVPRWSLGGELLEGRRTYTLAALLPREDAPESEGALVQVTSERFEIPAERLRDRLAHLAVELPAPPVSEGEAPPGLLLRRVRVEPL